MRSSGRLQLILWKARLRLRQSALLREIVRLARKLQPDTRERHLRAEVRYWRRWAATEGLQWPDDFAGRFDPTTPLQDHVARVVDRVPADRVEILDVGAGAATVLGKVHPTKQISITATDPLAREYNQVLDEYGKSPPVRTIYAEAEGLREQLGSRRFDVVHAQNSLDHSADAIAGLEEMLAVTKPGGFVILLHEENEGANELYYALHKWDFRCADGRFLISGPGPNGPCRDINDMMKGRAEVECSMLYGEVLVVMRKLPER